MSGSGCGDEPEIGLSWQHVGWDVRSRGAQQRFLHDVSGHALRGQVMALMGPSGSGKSVLLDILAMRKTLGKVGGCVLIDGCERRPGAFQRASAYIPHEDAFLPTLTVLETLQYHAEMRMPPGTSCEEKSARVEEVLRLVGLLRAARTYVGGHLPGGLSLRGLSGGEKRRLSIAAAMLPRPSLVFADEPTSGLDALASLKVLRVLKDVANAGKIVTVTVHQPRAAIWKLFDRLYLLSEGRLMYTGPTGGAATWFSRLGYEAPEDQSPADWLLDLVTTGFDKSSLGWRSLSSSAEVTWASARFAEGEPMQRIQEEVRQVCASPKAGATAQWPWSREATTPAGFAHWRHQCRTLLWRHALNYSRNLGNVAARLCLSTASGLVVGLCYSGLRAADARDPRTIPDRLGAMFFMCIVLMITPNCTMALFAADRRFYVVESAAQLYGPFAYYLPVACCELVLNVVAAGLFWLPVWALAGLQRDSGSFACGYLLCSLVQLCGSQIVNCCALLLPNQEQAFVVSVAMNIFAFITCGFLVRTQDLVAAVRYLRFFSPVKFGFQALAANELAGRGFGAERQLEALREALREVGAGGGRMAGNESRQLAWWLQQRDLRGIVSHVLDEVLPCVDPCITGMVEDGLEALKCLGLTEPATLAPAVLGLTAQLLALHALAWLCLRNLQGERR